MITDEIKLLAASQEEGENQYHTCPSCGREKKFSMKVEDGMVLYQCFRASCDLHAGGALRVSGQRLLEAEKRPQPRIQNVRPYLGKLLYLTREQEAFLGQRIGWDAGHMMTGQPMWAPGKRRYAFPIFCPMGRVRGWSLRSYEGAEPKALTRMHVEEPHMSWYYVPRPGKPTPNRVLVVEDIPSAVRASRYINAVALNGTGCGPDYAQELYVHAKHVTWALDADATQQAMALHKRYKLLFDSSRVMVLERDLKDTPEEELRCLLTPLT